MFLELFRIYMKRKNLVLCLAMICQASLVARLESVREKICLQYCSHYFQMILLISKCYKGLNLLTDEVHSLFDNQDTDVYFKHYLLLYADDSVIFAETTHDL